MRTKAIILKKQNTNEYDQLVTCYTEDFGKITAVAKSILKPNSIQAMHLDLFNLVDFELIHGRAFPIITGAQAEETFANLKNNLSRLAKGYFFAEVVDKTVFDHERDSAFWVFLVSLVTDLNSGLADGEDFLKNKQVELLNILGYAPNLNDCSFCGVRQTEFMAYNYDVRGMVCRDCFLGGRDGLTLKSVNPFGGNKELIMSGSVLSGIFESLAEKKLYSLNFLDQLREARISSAKF